MRVMHGYSTIFVNPGLAASEDQKAKASTFGVQRLVFKKSVQQLKFLQVSQTAVYTRNVYLCRNAGIVLSGDLRLRLRVPTRYAASGYFESFECKRLAAITVKTYYML